MAKSDRNEHTYDALSEDMMELRKAPERHKPQLAESYKDFLDKYSAFLGSYLQFLCGNQTQPSPLSGSTRWKR